MTRFIARFITGTAVLWIFVQGCGPRDEKTAPVHRIVINESDIQDSFPEAPLLSQVQFIPLETTRACIISEVMKAIETQGKLIVQDRHISSVVAAFDSTGKFLFTYGSKGYGVGQYVLPMDFAVDKKANELFVLNSERHTVNYYDLQTGNFKAFKPYTFPVRQIFKTENGFVFGGAARDKRVIFSNDELKRGRSFIDYTERYGITLINGLWPLNDSVLSFRLSFNDTIYKVGRNKVEPYILVDFKDKRLTPQYYDSLPDPQKRRLSDYAGDKMTHMAVFTENSQTRLFTFNYKSKRYVCLEDKASGRIKIFRADLFRDELLPVNPFPMIVGMDQQGNFLCFVNADRFINEIKGASLLPGHEALKKSIQHMDNVTPLSNPVLIKLQFKSF